jgi:hypothetical protein
VQNTDPSVVRKLNISSEKTDVKNDAWICFVRLGLLSCFRQLCSPRLCYLPCRSCPTFIMQTANFLHPMSLSYLHACFESVNTINV